jgi:cellulose synthase/poly-beta-1,6-N-acetylglucosamine synthase-like glycosyltransferase
MELLLLALYVFSLLVLFGFGLHGFLMVWHYLRLRPRDPIAPQLEDDQLPSVTIQLPLYNEMYVAERLVEAVCAIDYPRHKLQIQVLDDSTDATRELMQRLVEKKRKEGFDIIHQHRTDRTGFKAGALKEGMRSASGEFVAIFDADFVPPPDFLNATIPHLVADPELGLVQARWEHLNADHNLLTRVQAMALDAHFVMDQQIRNRTGYFINFNGTAGVWRSSCIEDAGNWHADTLTEDLDLSYRAQLRGWRLLYLNDVTAPAELPAEIDGLKSQQFRWTKGAIETARKLLLPVWRSDQPLKVKLEATGHLTSNLIFPFILLVAVLNVPVIYLKEMLPDLGLYFNLMTVFILATISSIAFHSCAQYDIHDDWRRRLRLFPLFMAGTMGLAVNNTRAVLEALFNKRSEFKRTPKYNLLGKSDAWKRSFYRQSGIGVETFIELALAVYFVFSIGLAIYYAELALIPFQLMFLVGFGLVSLLTLRNAWSIMQGRRTGESSVGDDDHHDAASIATIEHAAPDVAASPSSQYVHGGHVLKPSTTTTISTPVSR